MLLKGGAISPRSKSRFVAAINGGRASVICNRVRPKSGKNTQQISMKPTVNQQEEVTFRKGDFLFS